MERIEFSREVSNFEHAQGLVKELNKRAKRLKLPPVKIVETGRAMRQITINDAKMNVLFVDFYVEGEKPTIAGYKLAGTLEKHSHGNVVAAAHGFDADDFPANFRTEHYCDHCGTKRNRTKSVIFWNEEEQRYVMIGRSCMKDFFNMDLDRAVKFGGLFDTMIMAMEEEQLGGYMPAPVYTLKEVIDPAIYFIKLYGYVKGDDSHNTFLLIGHYLNPSKESPKWIKDLTIEEQEETAGMIEHYENIGDDASSFAHNVSMLVKDGYVEGKSMGIMVGACAGYLKIAAKLQERKSFEAMLPEPAPVVEGRIEITGWVLAKKVQDGYGYYSDDILKVLIMDERGFKVWGTAPSSIADDVQRKDKVKLTATVSKSGDDENFGFFKRPSKAEITEAYDKEPA